MTRPVSQVTTRTQRSGTARARSSRLSPGQVLLSSESGVRYRADRLLGAGGYGEVYLSRRLGAAAGIPEVVCVKVSPYMDAWLREAYFGQLLEGHPRAIQLFDRFGGERDGPVTGRDFVAPPRPADRDLGAQHFTRRLIGRGHRLLGESDCHAHGIGQSGSRGLDLP